MKTFIALLLATFLVTPAVACLPTESAVCVPRVDPEELLERMEGTTMKTRANTERMEDLIKRIDGTIEDVESTSERMEDLIERLDTLATK